MITKENCKKLENGKVIMDFAVFQELANAKIESLGAKAASSVSKKTDYVLANETSGSSKYKKAIVTLKKGETISFD